MPMLRVKPGFHGADMDMMATKISGLYVVRTTAHADHRGSFARAFCARDMAPALGDRAILQANLSHTSVAGALRGLHYQNAPHAEMKMVRCLRGRVWDVALDLRRNSPTFMQWHAEELSPDNMNAMLIPEGCAHGFQTLTGDCELLYLHTAFYEPSSEGGVHYADPRHNIAWPLPPTDISARDEQFALLDGAFGGI